MIGVGGLCKCAGNTDGGIFHKLNFFINVSNYMKLISAVTVVNYIYTKLYLYETVGMGRIQIGEFSTSSISLASPIYLYMQLPPYIYL